MAFSRSSMVRLHASARRVGYHWRRLKKVSNGDNSTAELAKVKGVVASMRAQGVEAVLTTLVERWYTDEFIAARPDAIEHRIVQVLGTPEDVFLSVFDVYASTEMAAWLSDVGHPCLVMTGEFDGGCNPRLNRLIDEALPDSELVILDDLKHSILVEGADAVLPPVRDFLFRHRD